MILTLRLSLLSGLLLLGAVVLPDHAGAETRPNIMFILADDLSWSDLGCFGHRYHDTPHLDKLAREGLRFTQAYAPAPICSASRAALLTGRSPARLNFEFVTKDKSGHQPGKHPLITPPYTLNLPLEETSMAEVLSPAGYHTAFFGKWHLNQHHGGYLGWSPTHGPLQQGFAEGDSDFGSHPYAYLKKEGRDMMDLPPGELPADTLTEKVVAFLQRPQEKPFFLYLSHYFVHDPIHTRSRWLFEKYRQKLPLDAPEDRAAYAAMVETLDYQVGRVLEVLEKTGLAKNTLVVFMSDNGGHPNYTANAPLRGSKWNLYEGGVRVPLIMRWPGHVPVGKSCDQVVHGCDLFPTFAEVAGATLEAQTPRDGMSLLPLLNDATLTLPERPLVWHFPYYHPEKGFDDAPPDIGISDFATSQTLPQSSILLGECKLIHFYEDDRDELYHLKDDLSEKHDLATSDPERTGRLRRLLDDYLHQVAARLPKRVNNPTPKQP